MCLGFPKHFERQKLKGDKTETIKDENHVVVMTPLAKNVLCL
jgi:hypothetical protein